MNFETFILRCLRERPLELTWTENLTKSLLDLCASTGALVDVLQHDGRPALMAHLAQMERERALVYYQLDWRPPTPNAAAGTTAPIEAALELGRYVGRLSRLVSDWLYLRHAPGERLKTVLHDVEQARAQLFAAVSIEPEELWRLPALGLTPDLWASPASTRPDAEPDSTVETSGVLALARSSSRAAVSPSAR